MAVRRVRRGGSSRSTAGSGPPIASVGYGWLIVYVMLGMGIAGGFHLARVTYPGLGEARKPSLNSPEEAGKSDYNERIERHWRLVAADESKERRFLLESVVQSFPDLTGALDAIIREGERPLVGRSRATDAKLAQVRVEIRDGTTRWTLSGPRINLVCQDVSAAELKTLRDELAELTVGSAARGIAPASPGTSSTFSPVIVLGSRGTIEVHGPSGSATQAVSGLHEQKTGHLVLSVHALDDPVQATLTQKWKEYCQSAPRAPPLDSVGALHGPRPPPVDQWTVMVAGQVDTLHIGGASDRSHQDIEIFSYFADDLTKARLFAGETSSIGEDASGLAKPGHGLSARLPGGHPPGGGGLRPFEPAIGGLKRPWWLRYVPPRFLRR